MKRKEQKVNNVKYIVYIKNLYMTKIYIGKRKEKNKYRKEKGKK